MNAAFLVLLYAGGLVVTIWSILSSGERPHVLLYAFIIDYLLRLATIQFLDPRLLARVTSPPARGQVAYPVRSGEQADAPPASFGGYVFAMIVFAFFMFAIIHANADQELEVDVRMLSRDLRWALWLGVFYWAQSLIARSIVIDPAASRQTNFGYNTKDVTVFALAVLTAGLVVVVRQQMELPPSGWAVLAPLLGWRTLYDLAAAFQARKRL